MFSQRLILDSVCKTISPYPHIDTALNPSTYLGLWALKSPHCFNS